MSCIYCFISFFLDYLVSYSQLMNAVKWGIMPLTLCILMAFLIHIDTKSMGLPSMYFKGSKFEISNVWCISVPEGCFDRSKQCRHWWCSIMLHFICVFTVCHCTRLGVCNIQRVNWPHTLHALNITNSTVRNQITLPSVEPTYKHMWYLQWNMIFIFPA